MVRRVRLVTVVLALAVLLAGCSGAGGSAVSSDGGGGGGGGTGLGADVTVAESGEQRMTSTPMATGTASGAPADRREGDGGDGGGDTEEQVAGQGRSVIRTGQVRLQVDDYAAAQSNLTAAVESRGGYVSDSVQQVHERGDEEWTSGRLVLRVPADQFGETMRVVEGEGEVLESRTSAQDVTEQVVDLQARLDNLRAERDRLRTLYQQANTTEDVLRVERRLSDVQMEIERTEARLQNIQRRVAYSTITVEMAEEPPDRPVPDQWYDTPVVQAFLDSVNGVGVVLRALVVAAAYAAPYLLAFLTPVALGGGALYVFLSRRRPAA